MTDEPKRVRPTCFDLNYDKYRRSKKHEDRIAAELGGRRLPRSGGLPWSPMDAKLSRAEGSKIRTLGADIQTKEFMVEHKRTVNKSMSVKLEWLEGVRAGAAGANRHPALAFTFERHSGPPEDWVAVPLSVFKQLIGKDP